MPRRGPIGDNSLEVICNGAIALEGGLITAIGPFADIAPLGIVTEMPYPSIATPGLVDSHTHLCFAGSRCSEYAKRLSGISYQDIAASGGGILHTVKETRNASKEELLSSMLRRLDVHLKEGITTCEVKSGYGLSIADEVKMLEVIQAASKMHPVNIIPTCLAAHSLPWEHALAESYLNMLQKELLPLIAQRRLAQRIDLFCETHAFSPIEALPYLHAAKNLGFDICLHANQFSKGGVELAAACGAISADHLEIIDDNDLALLRKYQINAVVLPGASLGLGIPFAPARRILDEGISLTIGSDWNPGSAPMGKLLLQAAVLGAAQKLSMAETWSAITARAARALALEDRGTLEAGMRADILAFSCNDYREILYHQGALLPSQIWVGGNN